MSSSAYAAQGSFLQIGGTGTARTVTGATNANPPRLTTSTAHGFPDGSLQKLSGFTGTSTDWNGKLGVIQVVGTNQFDLYGVDATQLSTLGTGSGTSTPTQSRAINVTGFSGFDGQAGEIDVSDFDSVAKEYLGGLQDFGNVQFNVQINDTDDGQNALRASKAAGGVVTPFKLTFRNAKFRSWNGFVKQFSEAGQVDSVITGTVAIRISGNVARG
jgi:hypothetical protein